jgi:NAD/NADP transhydrogenase beta subunit
MSHGEVVDVVIGVLVVGLLVARQMRTRPVREESSLRLTAILGILGILEVVSAAKGHSVPATTIAWVVAALAIGGALGVVRAFTVTISRRDDGVAMRTGTVLTAILWIVALGAHLAMEAAIDSSTTIGGFGASTLLLYVAVSYGVQWEVVRWRASNVRRPVAS